MGLNLDRAMVITQTTGTGAVTLGEAISPFQTLANAGAIDQFPYSYLIEDMNGAWELGWGVYTASSLNLTRNLIKSSTGALLSLSGAARVSILERTTDSGLVLREEQVASASTELDFKNTISAAFDSYEFELVGITPDTTGRTLGIQASTNGGSSWDTGSNYAYSHFGFSSAGTAVGGSASATSIQAAPFAGRTMATTANFSQSGRFTLSLPSGKYPIFQGFFNSADSVQTTPAQGVYMTGYYLSVAAAVNAIRFLISAGSFSGTIRSYGRTKGAA